MFTAGATAASSTMNVTVGTWAFAIGTVLTLLVIDLVTSSRKPHDVKFREAALWSVFFISVAIGFGVWVWQSFGSQFGSEYFAAYLVELSLSVDNLFVFAIILTQFAVPSVFHQRILLVGVLLAMVLRGIFIAIGAAALHAFAFSFVVFGGILIWTGIGLLRHWNEDPDPSDNVMVRAVRRMMPVTDTYNGAAMFVRENGKRYATPILLVMVAIAATDLLFALDSIPATFGVTQQPFLVFAANAFALMGLRALYFLLKGLLDKLVYLSIALAVILIFIGVKLVLLYGYEAKHSWGFKLETNTSLMLIAAILVVATVASLIKSAKDPSAKAHAGRVTGEHDHGKQTSASE